MGNKSSPWAFSFLLLTCATAAYADGIPVIPQSATMSGAPSYVPNSAANSAAVQSFSKSQGVTVPGANSGQPGSVPSVTVPTPETIPAPSTSTTNSSTTGQYRNKNGDVKLDKMLLDRYEQSMVTVTAKDLAGNELARAMGVGVGRSAQFIAVPLSLLLGNEQQWADKIEITHLSGNKYGAKVALIDEEKNIVLLAPEAYPAPLPNVREENERPQITVFTISFENGPPGTPGNGKIGKIHRGMLAAANLDTGLLSVAGAEITDDQAGTGIINSMGELVGMLLPGNRGVLATSIQNLVEKAEKATPIEPNRIGVILGRGVIVGDKLTKGAGVFPTIDAALEAIKKGDAPKTDPTLYIPARNRAVAPKEADKVVVKVMPGTYKQTKTLRIPSNLSLSGSGPDRTTIQGTDPNQPLILVQEEENSLVAGFRIIPAAKQTMKAPTIIVNRAKNVTILGNVVETRGGIGVWALQSMNVRFNGNAFPAAGTAGARAISCDHSGIGADANAFVGDWSTAVSLDQGCNANLARNLFFSNKISVMASPGATSLKLTRSTFVRDSSAVKIGYHGIDIQMGDNLFYECTAGLDVAGGDTEVRRYGRSGVWKTRMVGQGKNLLALDLVRTEPHFMSPEAYDFRLRPGQAQLSTAISEPGNDLGAFQEETYLGPFTQQLVRSLGVATGQPNLANLWGFTP